MDYLFGSSGEEAIGNRKLRLRIGPSLESLEDATPNDETNPHFIDSPYFVGNIVVRVKHFRGLGKILQADEYFGTRKRLFALQVCGRFKHEYSAEDVVFGAEFEEKVSPPTGTWVALKFANLIDPALVADVYADKPWLYSPILCSMNLVNVHTSSVPISGAAPSKQNAKSKSNDSDSSVNLLNGPDPSFHPTSFVSLPLDQVDSSKFKVSETLGDWVWSGTHDLTEDNSLLIQVDDGEPFESDAIAERRKFFQKQKVRKGTLFKPEHVYNFEIFAPFIDLNTFDLTLGININLLKYLNNQPIRLMAKSRSTNIVFFVIEFDLVPDPEDVEIEDDVEPED